MEIMRGCVFLVSLSLVVRRLLIYATCMQALQRYDALATDGDTGSASGTRVSTLFVATLQRLVTSRPSLLGVSA